MPNYSFKPSELALAMGIKGAYGLLVDGLGQLGESAAHEEKVKYNFLRSLRYASVGVFLLAPLEYGEWLIISSYFPRLTIEHAFAKTVIDIVLLHPFNAASAMYTNEMLRSKSNETAIQKIKQDFFSLQWRMIVIRPIVDMIAFTSIGSFTGQMIFMGTIYLCIDVFVNIAVNRRVKDKDEVAVDNEVDEEEFIASRTQTPLPGAAETASSPTPPDHVDVEEEKKRRQAKSRHQCCGLFWFTFIRKKPKEKEPAKDEVEPLKDEGQPTEKK